VENCLLHIAVGITLTRSLQVKIRGQRVELGEVAEGVRLASDVPLDVAALVVQHPELARPQLVAFVARNQTSSTRNRQAPTVVYSDVDKSAPLRAACEKLLPIFMVPDLIVPLTYIPVAQTSAKIDNKLLTRIFHSTPMSNLLPRGTAAGASGPISKRPLNDAELEVANIIASALKQTPSAVYHESKVFELGVDSLSAIALYSRLKAAGYSCNVATVMKNPTVERIALFPRHDRKNAADQASKAQVKEQLALLERRFADETERAVPLEKVAAVRPCLPLQEVLVSRSMQEDAGVLDVTYVNHVRFELTADVHVPFLPVAWEELARCNDILRTCFAMIDDKPVQVVLRPEAYKMRWIHQTIPSIEDLKRVEESTARDMVASILSQPPWRLTWLLDESTGKESLLLSIHHSLYDGESFEMMLHDLQCFYNGQDRGDLDPQLRPDTLSLIEYIISHDKERSKAFWTSVLNEWRNAPLLDENVTSRAKLQTSERHFSTKLSAFEKQMPALNTTLATFLQFAFAAAMSQHLQTNDFIYGLVLSGRTIPVENVDKMMVPCVTTLPQRLIFDKADTSALSALQSLQELNSASLDHQHISPREILRWTEAERSLYDCLFSFIKHQSTQGGQQPFLRQVSNEITVDYPLAVEIEADASTDEVIARVSFSSAFGASSDAELLLEKIELLTDVILSQRDMKVEAFGLPIGISRNTAASAEVFDETTWSPLEQKVRSMLSRHTGIPESQIQKQTSFIHLGEFP
jgi:ferricrocin synthase